MRNHQTLAWICIFLFLALVISACSPAATVAEQPPEQAFEPDMGAPAAEESFIEAPPIEAPAVEQPATDKAADESAPPATSSLIDSAFQPEPNRLIIKNGEMRLQVEDVDVALDRVMQMVADLGGYVISSQTRFSEVYGQNVKFATINLGVPSVDFETAMRRLREISLKVLNESATGQDVTDEYVDNQSRLESLQATRERILEFLDQAKTVEEALKVNEQLKEIESEIEQVQGRMNYLFDRAAYSTIMINLEPFVPEPTPTLTPTITVTPTPFPTLTPTPWAPGETFTEAGSTLGNIFRTVVNAVIYIGVVCVPFVIPVVGLVWLIIWLRRKFPPKRKVLKHLPQPPVVNSEERGPEQK